MAEPFTVDCFICKKPFPVDFTEQGAWVEIKKAVGGGFRAFVCPDCGLDLIASMIEKRMATPSPSEQEKTT